MKSNITQYKNKYKTPTFPNKTKKRTMMMLITTVTKPDGNWVLLLLLLIYRSVRITSSTRKANNHTISLIFLV